MQVALNQLDAVIICLLCRTFMKRTQETELQTLLRGRTDETAGSAGAEDCVPIPT